MQIVRRKGEMDMAGDMQQEILDELRNQTAMFRKVNRINIIVVCIFLAVIAIMMALTPVLQRMLYTSKASFQRADSWQEARSLWDQGESPKANEMVQRLIKKYPNYWYGYALLGSFHQELGKFKEAEEDYTKAYDLFPIEENRKTLVAIRAVLKKNATANK
jgi:tetratricopeptide (TPR) repeat protein